MVEIGGIKLFVRGAAYFLLHELDEYFAVCMVCRAGPLVKQGTNQGWNHGIMIASNRDQGKEITSREFSKVICSSLAETRLYTGLRLRSIV
jgi:hypothetical protein